MMWTCPNCNSMYCYQDVCTATKCVVRRIGRERQRAETAEVLLAEAVELLSEANESPVQTPLYGNADTYCLKNRINEFIEKLEAKKS